MLVIAKYRIPRPGIQYRKTGQPFLDPPDTSRHIAAAPVPLALELTVSGLAKSRP